MIRSYQSGDAKKVLVQKEQREEAKVFAQCFDKIRGYSLEDEKGNILGVFGYVIDKNKCAFCYALIGQNIKRKILEVVRFFLREIPYQMQQKNVEKVVITVKENFLSGQRFAKMLGFSSVAVLENFYAKKNYQLFERRT